MEISNLDVMIRLFAIAIFSAAIGFEREYHGKSAGMRTNILVGMGSALAAIASIKMAEFSPSPRAVDVSRIASAVLMGIGFLGAGTILKGDKEGHIHGLTTAASIWIVSAIGIITGMGLLQIGFIATILTLVVLVILRTLSVPEKHEPTK